MKHVWYKNLKAAEYAVMQKAVPKRSTTKSSCGWNLQTLVDAFKYGAVYKINFP